MLLNNKSTQMVIIYCFSCSGFNTAQRVTNFCSNDSIREREKEIDERDRQWRERAREREVEIQIDRERDRERERERQRERQKDIERENIFNTKDT